MVPKCDGPPKLVKLNVGGHFFETTTTTLEKASFFGSLFSGHWNLTAMTDDGGRIFVDRDGTYFSYLLSFCRGTLPRVVLDSLDRTTRLRLIADATYFGLPEFTEALVVPPVGATVRYAYNRPLGSRGLQVVVCVGTVDGYIHASRSWRVHVHLEGPVVTRGDIPSNFISVSPREDTFSWDSPPGILDAERLLMPFESQKTSLGKPLVAFMHGSYNSRHVEWQLDDGRWIDILSVPVGGGNDCGSDISSSAAIVRR